ncbi:antibiotic biosynthesis monooxygenase family protein [Saccharomonospora xinjiangensis]|uniref:antibiotic biosynthesis monooxygenase family protein n=1 Tax=Saccharomonospora xinjiangensis TaxID=75294 RepID=UPI00106F2ECA|nr:antibiotic biosynthesis monooxygenase family protein [Saccharomonospora xinjiangensis]QBQ60412.1 Antibiotic biosynthesis monooxygenase [Saccharomonospora xinjiangensis]
MTEKAGFRVLFLLTLKPGAQERFLAAYEAVRWVVARVPGHLGDQVCQSTEDPEEWLLTSQWRSAEDFLAWERTPEHRALAAPMLAAVARRRSQRYVVRHDTVGRTGTRRAEPAAQTADLEG